MRIHVLQHVPFEGPANVGVWATRTGHDLAVTNLHHGDALPPIDAADALVVLGGLMSVTDEQEYPWLVAEKAPFVQKPERIRADIARNVARTKRWLDALLDSWLGRGVAMAAS